jgi:hypothetical protein
MRKYFDTDVLQGVVNCVCDTLDNFSAFDVTSKIREKFPNFEVLHSDVRDFVIEYANDNSLVVNDNGRYKTYIKVSNPKLQPVFLTTFPVATALTPIPPTTFQTTQQVPVVKKLQSEHRINLTQELRERFPKTKTVYLVKENNTLRFYPTRPSGSYNSLLDLNEEVRVRTGFSSTDVELLFSNDVLEVRPKV